MKLVATEAFDDTVEAGRIVSQDPPSGTPGHRGDTVNVVVSKGPEPVALPNTYGQNIKTAQKALEDLGFVVKVQHPQGISPLNLVYSQNPGGGEGKTAPKGSTITLNVF
jgi:serine/threonine-protein kinase